MMLRIWIVTTFLFATLNANQCSISDAIMLTILKTEGHKARKLGYEYIISFNNTEDAELVGKSNLQMYFIDKRSLDCKNLKFCVKITKALWKIGIRNLDLGAWQINSNSHFFEAEEYFNFNDSYYNACKYVEKNTGRHGFTWYAIAGYHSFTKEHNYRYQGLLKANYNLIKRKSQYVGVSR